MADRVRSPVGEKCDLDFFSFSITFVLLLPSWASSVGVKQCYIRAVGGGGGGGGHSVLQTPALVKPYFMFMFHTSIFTCHTPYIYSSDIFHITHFMLHILRIPCHILHI